MSAEDIAKAFHEAYEQLAPRYGYETRRESAVPWGDVPFRNRALMVATVKDLIDRQVIFPPGADSTGTLQDDLAQLCRALGLFDGARPQSPHEVMMECIAEVERRQFAGNIRRIRDEVTTVPRWPIIQRDEPPPDGREGAVPLELFAVHRRSLERILDLTRRGGSGLDAISDIVGELLRGGP